MTGAGAKAEAAWAVVIKVLYVVAYVNVQSCCSVCVRVFGLGGVEAAYVTSWYSLVITIETTGQCPHCGN